jgi:hypothetical protein
MKLSNLVSVTAIAAAALCISVTPSVAQDEEEEPILDTFPVLQGGFSYRDKRNKDDGLDLNAMTMLSDGVQILGGGRVRSVTAPLSADTCFDVVWSLQAIDNASRSDKKLKYNASR